MPACRVSPGRYVPLGEPAAPALLALRLLRRVRAIRHVMYNCTASRPSIESSTKEETIEPGTETLSLTADPREDGLVKSRTGDDTSAATYQNWYQSVYVPQVSASGSDD